MADKKIKTDNELLKSMAKKVGNTIVGTHTDNYYLKKIEAKIGQGGGGYDDTDLKEKMGYDSIPAGESLQGQIGELQTAVGDLDDGLDDKADVGHTHTESDITDLGDYIEKSNIDGLVKNDGTIDEHTYSQSGHTHLMADVTDLSLPAPVKVVTDKGTASADTMDKLYIEVSGNSADVYYTTKSGNTYSWHKLDTDILDDLSIDWSDIQNKPSIPADVSDLTDTTGVIPTDISDLTDTTDIIPSDVSDLTDTNNTAFTPKSHTHTMSDVTDLDIPSDVSDLTDSTGVIPTDVSDLTDTNNTQFTPKSHTHTESDITNLGDYIEKSNTAGLVKNDGSIDTNTYLTQHQDITGKLDIAQTSYKGKNVVVDSTTGDITFENKPTIPTDVADLTDTHDTAFTPKTHNHDDAYYTKSQVDDLINGALNHAIMWGSTDIIQSGDTATFYAYLMKNGMTAVGETVCFDFGNNGISKTLIANTETSVGSKYEFTNIPTLSGDSDRIYLNEEQTIYIKKSSAGNVLRVPNGEGESQIFQLTFLGVENGTLTAINEMDTYTFDISSTNFKELLSTVADVTIRVYGDCAVTDDRGIATVQYTGVGAGQIGVRAKSGSLQSETYSIIDAHFVDIATTGKKNTYWYTEANPTITTTDDGTTISEVTNGVAYLISTVASTTTWSNRRFIDADFCVEFDIDNVENTNMVFYLTGVTGAKTRSLEDGHYKFYVRSTGVTGEFNGIPFTNPLYTGTVTTANCGFQDASSSTTMSFRYKNFKIYAI